MATTKTEEEVIVEKAVKIISSILEKQKALIENFLNMLSGRQAQISFKLDNIKFQFGKATIVISGEANLSVQSSKTTTSKKK